MVKSMKGDRVNSGYYDLARWGIASGWRKEETKLGIKKMRGDYKKETDIEKLEIEKKIGIRDNVKHNSSYYKKLKKRKLKEKILEEENTFPLEKAREYLEAIKRELIISERILNENPTNVFLRMEVLGARFRMEDITKKISFYEKEEELW